MNNKADISAKPISVVEMIQGLGQRANRLMCLTDNILDALYPNNRKNDDCLVENPGILPGLDRVNCILSTTEEKLLDIAKMLS